MSPRVLFVHARRRFRRSRLLQIGVVVGLWLAGELAARTMGIPVPGGLIGMGLALGLLALGRVSLFSLKRGADWFLAEMLLFFVPAVLAVMNHQEFLGLLGLKLLAIIVLSTLAVMAVTALSVDLCWRWRKRDACPVVE
ncbi:CidA/LrgA family protein [Pararhodospirillum oryzae]|uniref:CidA/LrgA family protein n=1 Tax=Pararhodospirillum oryzae TaxID=478448 RepID=A0A512HC25_9PROT|nr:CidA/LrgA family protein [Pararhodospirillum oryzae]GEO83002.1 hypothetical protein ROR02_31330 [Pararhodospirillum oryzae]